MILKKVIINVMVKTFKLLNRDIDMRMNTSKKVKKLIKEYYEFYGYQQFSNKIKNLLR